MGVDARSLSLRARTERDASEVVAWVPDAAALFRFSGARLQWPLTAPQLQEMLTIEGLSAWVAVGSAPELVAHFDLTLEGRSLASGG